MAKIKISELFTDKQKNWLLGLLALTTVFSLLLNITSPLNPKSSEAGWFGLGGWLRSSSFSRNSFNTSRQNNSLQDYRASTGLPPSRTSQDGTTTYAPADTKVLDLGFSYSISDLKAANTADYNRWVLSATLTQKVEGQLGAASKTSYYQSTIRDDGGYVTFPSVFVTPSQAGSNFEVLLIASRHVFNDGVFEQARCSGRKTVWVPVDFAGNSISENLGDLNCTYGPITFGLNPVPDTENIRSEINNKGSARVIITLHGNSITDLGSSVDEYTRTQEVKRLQDEFLANYSPSEMTNVKRITFSPILGVGINMSAYHKMLNDVRVRSFQLDRPEGLAQ